MQLLKLLLTCSQEFTHLLIAMLNTDAIITLQSTCQHFYELLHECVEARCKRECLDTYLHSTLAASRVGIAVSSKWRSLYVAFRTLNLMRWVSCDLRSPAMAEALRLLKSDSHEYTADVENQLLLKSGGHYWFNVAEVSTEKISIVLEMEEPVPGHDKAQSTIEDALCLLSASQTHVVEIQRWERIRASGTKPCPRRYHSMTCLPNRKCRLDFFLQDDIDGKNGPESSMSGNICEDRSLSKQVLCGDQEVIARRILVFGGQSEGLPFSAYNDLYMLVITSIPMTEWIRISRTSSTKPQDQ
uniref:Uncharacterized protein AlNc14C7G926 n=1 Tax=Albugo laibachii Nc14 TaxID=890382 RepID=F0W1F7_9STRA|nr:conserved hypothetical protein [Albugo laibachii Nc14]|eukprot:CCA14886.1 conserved hypothetical protein [Albugo laibachii Nc14]